MKDLRILLRDRDSELVAAWARHFAGIAAVEVGQGDIFERSADAVVSPANSFGFMDGGIDLVLSHRFGWELSDRLRQRIEAEHDGELLVGEALLLETHDPEIPFLVSAPTMRVPQNVAETPNAYLAFRAVLRAARAHERAGARPMKSILCPGLATATGRMPPERCAFQMAIAYREIVLGERSRPDSLFECLDAHAQLCRFGAR
jgi:O-acetyl-ADP-ribose deacetylase (regulator of RNase III)